jgi:diacylglycerol kinase (ATP)
MKITGGAVNYCVNVSAGGINGLFDESASREAPAWRPLTYLRAALQTAPLIRPFRATITLDDDPPLTISLFELVIANGRYVAHGISVAPEAQLDDGLLDVILFRSTSLASLVLLAPAVLLGRHLKSDEVIFRRARNVVVQSEPDMWLSVEGEVLGTTPASYTVLPGALTIVAAPCH